MNAIPNGSWALSSTAFKKLGPSKTFNSFFLNQGTRLPYTFISATGADNGQNSSEEGSEVADPVKRAFERAKAYKKLKVQGSDPSTSTVPEKPVSNPFNQGNKNEGDASSSSGEGGDGDVPLSVKLAMKKATEYAKEKGKTGGVENDGRDGSSIDGKKGRKEVTVEEGSSDKKVGSISRLDFLGLDFADKKSGRGLPAGLIPVDDSFAPGELPEVEIIVGDQSKFASPTGSKLPTDEGENVDVYKPKVSTWGVFPRPSNISKTYGGGRTIRPGQVLESAEDKAAKEAQTRKLLSEYKVKMGLNIDPKTKLECEKALQDGNSLMERGKLEEAINYYERIMNSLVFQTELHGFAALQWSICQDSLSRSDKARVMYEKLQSHPNTQVRKKAKQFVFGFQAMEMMKVRSLSTYKSTGYHNYFDAFVDDQSNYSISKEEKEDDVIMEVVPYFIFLLTPIVLLLLVALRKIA